MAGAGLETITRNGYRVEIDGLTAGDFLAVEALETSSVVTEYRSAGDPTVYKLPGVFSCANIELTRRWTGNPELWAWRRSALTSLPDRRSGAIAILNARGDEIGRFTFARGWPCRWRLGPWRADASDLLVETVELAVEAIDMA